MPGEIQRFYSYLLLFLFCLFLFSVIAPALAGVLNISWLPDLTAWESDRISYSVIITAQIVIILIALRVIHSFWSHRVKPVRQTGIICLVFGGFYFTIMMVRLMNSVFYMIPHPWWDKPLPAFFNIVLATFILVVGHFHYEFGKK